MQMIDMHAHIIPGVDDGSESMEMTLSMMLRACDQGVCGFFATPHSSAFDANPSQVRGAFGSLQAMAGRYFPKAPIWLGCEVYCDSTGMDSTLRALGQGKYPTMNDTAYVLAEFSQWVTPENTLPCMEKLTAAGWKPIIAHMERYRYLRNDHDLVKQLRDLGCLIQVNAYSLSDETEGDIKSWARQLAVDRRVDFLGTDMHRTYHRPPSAELGLNWLYENCGKEYADAIAFGNARQKLIGIQG